MLDDGRGFAVVYKGADRMDTGDTKEKTNIGERWASKNQDKSVFLIAQIRDEQGRGVREQLVAALT